ncbi:hypothetical protein [Haloferax elongans]|uniref:hypothetical protein n=1 Tax=Haloferax elongans TaxID=403191 RepID=UPI0012676032|nr:hypothetical protein [Haloferax elongans]
MSQSNDSKVIPDGFDHVPAALVSEKLVVRCMTPDIEPEFCDGWVEEFETEKTAVRADGYGKLHFPDHVTTECPECGDRVLEVNGVEVTFHV